MNGAIDAIANSPPALAIIAGTASEISSVAVVAGVAVSTTAGN